MYARSALAALVLALVGATPAQESSQPARSTRAPEAWSPRPSETRIAFRVVFPEGTPQDEAATLVLEASDPAGEVDWVWAFRASVGLNYRAVDTTPVTDGQVVRLRMPVAAEAVRVRLEATYMTNVAVHLDGVEEGRPAIVLRPDPASRVRVEITAGERGTDDSNTVDLGPLVGAVFTVRVDAERPPRGGRPETASLRVDATLGAELVALARGRTLTLPPRHRMYFSTPETGARAAGVPFGLVGPPHVVTAERTQTWRLQAVPLTTVIGRVETAAGTPIVGASVMINSGAGAARTDLDGRFRLMAWPRDLRGSSLSVSAARHEKASVTLDDPVVVDRTMDIGVVQLTPFASIAGRLTLADGRPVADFPLVIGTSYPSGGTEARTDAGGRFLFDTVSAESVVLRGWARLDTAGEPRAIDSDATATAYEVAPLRVSAGDSGLELSVRPVRVLEGHVQFDDDAPVRSVHLAAQVRDLPAAPAIPQGGGQLEATLPVVDGRFEWDRLPPGRWKIFVSADFSQQTWQTLDLGAQSDPPHFAIPRPAVLAGKVMTAEGEPVAGARVVARGVGGKWHSTATDHSGAFVIDRLPPGDYSISSWIESARTEVIDAGAHPRGVVAPDELELRFPAGPKLTVVVVDGATGEPVRFTTVDVEREGSRLPHVTTNAQGLARFGPLEPGDYDVEVYDWARPTASSMLLKRSRSARRIVVAAGPDMEITITRD